MAKAEAGETRFFGNWDACGKGGCPAASPQTDPGFSFIDAGELELIRAEKERDKLEGDLVEEIGKHLETRKRLEDAERLLREIFHCGDYPAKNYQAIQAFLAKPEKP